MALPQSPGRRRSLHTADVLCDCLTRRRHKIIRQRRWGLRRHTVNVMAKARGPGKWHLSVHGNNQSPPHQRTNCTCGICTPNSWPNTKGYDNEVTNSQTYFYLYEIRMYCVYQEKTKLWYQLVERTRLSMKATHEEEHLCEYKWWFLWSIVLTINVPGQKEDWCFFSG